MVSQGPHGIQSFVAPVEDEVGDIHSYGVDWDVNDDPVLMTHLLEHNPQDWESGNPFAPATSPDNMNTVECEPAGCPLTAMQLTELNTELHHRFDVFS